MHPLRIISLVVLLQLSHTSVAAQQADTVAALPDMAQVEQAWAQGDFVFVRGALAQQTGSALAQYRYGRVLVEGRGGPQDIDGAAQWLQRAVDQNSAQAAALLAQIYLSDLDTDVPLETRRSPERAAFRWLLAAAQQQNAKAQFALARAYARGIGTQADPEQVIRWLSEAASAGHPQAQLSLARAYDTGSGVAVSAATALDIYRRAAEGGVVEAQQILGHRLLFGAQDVTPDPQEGLRWLTAAAQAGAPGAMAGLGRAYITGTGVAQDDAQAARWYSKAAQYDHGRAKTAFAAMNESGRGVPVDFEAALTLYQQALAIPDGNAAASRLGQLVADGALDGRFAPQRMVPWALAAMEAGSVGAGDWLRGQAQGGLRAALADLYLATPETAAEGAQLLQQAATGGDSAAMLRLGRMLMVGDQVALDYVAAHQWINIAATLGEGEAAELRTTLTALMTPDQLAQAQASARNWLATGQPQPPQTVQSVTQTPAPVATDAGRN